MSEILAQERVEKMHSLLCIERNKDANPAGAGMKILFSDGQVLEYFEPV